VAHFPACGRDMDRFADCPLPSVTKRGQSATPRVPTGSHAPSTPDKVDIPEFPRPPACSRAALNTMTTGRRNARRTPVLICYFTPLKELLHMHPIASLRLFSVCVGLFLVASLSSAQTKLAVINLQRAVLESAEIQKASAALEAKYKPRQQDMEKVQKDLQNIQQQLQANQGKFTPQAEADLVAQGQRKQRELQRMTDDLQADVDRERNEILGKSTQRMQEVVKKLAEEKGYDVVVDISNTIYYKPALEITSDALAAYNKAYPAK